MMLDPIFVPKRLHQQISFEKKLKLLCSSLRFFLDVADGGERVGGGRPAPEGGAGTSSMRGSASRPLGWRHSHGVGEREGGECGKV